MAGEQIKNLEQLLKEHIGNAIIVATKVSRLLAPGENLGSELKKLDIVLKNKENNALETLHVVGKFIPASKLFQHALNIQLTVKKEIAFYDTIVPTLQEFQRQQGLDQVIDLFPKLYGARINLDGKSDTVDEDAVLLLENLKVLGYTNVNRLKGFNLETTKLILENLATFHAVPLAIKLTKPEVFQAKMAPYLGVYSLAPDISYGPWRYILDFLEGYQQCKPLIPLIKENIRRDGPPEIREPFATVVHDDMWSNNIMLKFENDKPIKLKFVDFQSFKYASPAEDLVFFFWSSVQKPVLEKNLDDLMQFYHEKFTENLQQLNCNIMPFSYERFLKEMEIVSKFNFGHILFLIMIVVFGKTFGPTLENVITLEGKERALYFIEECSKRGWLP